MFIAEKYENMRSVEDLPGPGRHEGQLRVGPRGFFKSRTTSTAFAQRDEDEDRLTYV